MVFIALIRNNKLYAEDGWVDLNAVETLLFVAFHSIVVLLVLAHMPQNPFSGY